MILYEISFFCVEDFSLQARSPEEAMAALMEATKIIGGALDMFGSILLKSMVCFQK
jgi:hypothetical protein